MNGNKIKTIKIIHYTQLAGVFLFIMITYANSHNLAFTFDIKNFNFQLGLGLGVVAIFAHKLIYIRALQDKFNLKTTLEKWNKYQTFHLIRMAILEGAAIVNIVLVYTSGNSTHLVFAFILFIIMNEYLPNAKKIAAEWDLTEQEINEL